MSFAESLIRPPPGAKQTLQQFILFTQLPTEIRIRVWTTTVPQARISQLQQNDDGTKFQVSPRSVPALLHTCQESRTEGLRAYELLVDDCGPTH